MAIGQGTSNHHVEALCRALRRYKPLLRSIVCRVGLVFASTYTRFVTYTQSMAMRTFTISSRC